MCFLSGVAAEFIKESLVPGKKGFLTLTYNASIAGIFSKTATVTANTDPGVTTLHLTGEVVATSKTGRK